jgi:regulator of sigma E protease
VFVPADKENAAEEEKLTGEYGLADEPIDFTDEKIDPTWAFVAERMLIALPGTKLKLAIRRDGAKQQVELPIVDYAGYYHADRGLQLDRWKEIDKAENAGQAIAKGLRQTGNYLTAVLRFLRKIYNDIQAGEHLGSAITIAGAAGAAAQEGWPDLLMFMTLISANLAVINFLPIPVLDGGHMMFLTYEAIRGKPADEKWLNGLTLIGFAFLICLMLFVFSLDIFRFAGVRV